MAATRRPLRSKRARISPLSARWKASGLTRMRVRSTCGLGAGRRLRLAHLGHGGLLGRRPGSPATPAWLGRLARDDLGLAVGTHLPPRVEGAGAVRARALQPAHAV